jgi:hypothetical protein
MAGRNSLLVAKEHGHRLMTMLTVYAAWTDGVVEADIATLREAMNRTDRPPPTVTRRATADVDAQGVAPVEASRDRRALHGRRRPP